jgi:uncharacterized YigZ family protein
MDKKELISYKSVKSESETEEIVITKSRFIGYASHTMTENDAKNFIESVSEKHPEASCICHAYICGMSGQIQRFHDGHEPVGGMPILEVMKMKDLTAITCAVVRYFGGVKLGVGGLARAFSNTAVKAIESAKPCTYHLSEIYQLSFDYTYQGKIEYALTNSEHKYGNINYLDKIIMDVVAKCGSKEKINAIISAVTSANHVLELKEKKYICWDD